MSTQVKPEVKNIDRFNAPPMFYDALCRLVEKSEDTHHLEGWHRIVYMDTQTGKRTTTFIQVGDSNKHRFSYVFWPYMQAKDYVKGLVSPDPWGCLNGSARCDQW